MQHGRTDLRGLKHHKICGVSGITTINVNRFSGLVFIVIMQTKFFDPFLILFNKRSFRVMFILIFNIILHFINLRFAYRKSTSNLSASEILLLENHFDLSNGTTRLSYLLRISLKLYLMAMRLANGHVRVVNLIHTC